MAKAETASTRAPRGTKPVSQAFFLALDKLPEAQHKLVFRAALASIREEMKTRGEKAKTQKAKMTNGKATARKMTAKSAKATGMKAMKTPKATKPKMPRASTRKPAAPETVA